MAPVTPPRSVIPTPAPAARTKAKVRSRCPVHDTWRRCLRKTGNNPNTSIEKSVKLNTCVVDGKRDANTVEAITAAFVDREAGNFAAPALSPLP